MEERIGEATERVTSPGPATSPVARRAGVYVLASDGVAEWLAAMLASIRQWNPAIPVTLIPYDDRLNVSVTLCDAYGVDVLSCESLPELDAWAAPLVPRGGFYAPGTFRKFAAFWGPYERFLMLDVDIVVTMDVRPLLDRPPVAGIWYAHPASWWWVYRPGPLLQELTRNRGTAMTTGIWAAWRGLLSDDDVRGLLAEAKKSAAQFAASAEQPILNWIVSEMGWPVRGPDEVVDGVRLLWAGHAKRRQKLRTNSAAPRTSDSDGRPVGVVHWAGFQLHRSMPLRNLWRSYRWQSRRVRAVDATLTCLSRSHAAPGPPEYARVGA